MARDRSIKLVIQAQVDGAKRALNETAQAAKKVGDEADKASRTATTASGRMVQSARDNSQAWTTAGATLTAFGAAGALALGGSAKAAIDWESAWAGVTKTVDGSERQLAGLNEGLREMARELPASHGEIAAVAEAAGQLGIATEDVESFTRTMIDLSETTNLTADEAATSIAQMANVMGTSGDDIDNLGSALVALGNNGASTERQIIQMAQAMSGAAAVVGMAESDVLGIANAMASMGIEVEAGGSSVSRILTDMAKAASTGSEELTTFADVAGMSAEQFATAFKEDPAEAFAAFIGGLGDMQAAGEDVFTVLDELGLSDVRVSRALLGMATSGDLLTDSLKLGAEAWAENTALTDEAAQRYDTVASKIQVAKNNIYDAGISLGETFLPAISAMAEGAADAAGAVASLPPEMQGIIGAAGVAATSVGLLAGGFLLLAPRAVDAYDAFKSLTGISPRMNAALGNTARVAAAGGALVVGLGALGAALGAIQRATQEAVPSVEDFTGALLDMSDGAGIATINTMLADLEIQVNGLSGMAEGPISDFGGALDRLLDPSFIQRAEGLDKAISFGQVQTSGDRVLEFFGQLDGALSGLVAGGNADLAAEQFERLVAAAAAEGYSREQIIDLFPSYAEALKGIDNEARLAAEGTEVLAEQVEDLNGQFVKIDPSIMQGKVAEIEQYNRDILASFIDLSNEIGNQDVSLDAWWASIEEQFTAQAAFIDNIAYLRGQGMNEAFVQGLIDEGPAGATRTQQIVDAMTGSDEGHSEWLDRGNEFAGALDQGVRDGLSETDPVVIDYELQQEAGKAAERKAELESAFLREGPVEVPLDADPAPMQQTVNDQILWAAELNGIVHFDADGSLAYVKIDEWNEAAENTTGMPKLDADPAKAKEQLADYMGDAADTTGVAILDANNNPAIGATDAWWYDARGTTGTATLDAYNGPAFSALNSFLNAIPRSVSVSIRAVPIVGNLFAALGGGRAEGGWTGPGGKYDPVDFVHADEFVHTKENVNRPGMLNFHTDLWRTNDLDGAYLRHKLRGYADGGPVGTAPAMSAASPLTASVDSNAIREAARLGVREGFAGMGLHVNSKQAGVIVASGSAHARVIPGGLR